MGQTISKSNFKNFTFPVFKQSNKLKNSVAGYPSCQIIDQSYMKNACSIFSLKQKRQITKQELKKQQYNYQFKSDMTLLTYNVWFQPHNEQNRIKAIFSILKQSKADIICLQQVNSTFLKSLHQYGKDLTNQFDYFMPIMNMHWYDTLVLVKFPCKFYKIPFQSTMNRCDLLAVFQIKTKQVITTVGINTVHLQSLNNQKLRMNQFQIISNINKKLDLVIIAGDFNFSDNYKQNKIIQQKYIDLWKHTKPNQEQSYTMPATQRFDQWRPDHIIIKSNIMKNQQFAKNANFQISRIGNFTISPFQFEKVTDIAKDNIVRSPSDHFGLFSQISF